MQQSMLIPSLSDLPDDLVDRYTTGLCEVLIAKATRPLFDRRCRESSRQPALEWLLSDAVAPFSFVCCCMVLGVNPESLRRSIFSMVRAAQKRRAS